MTRLYPPEIEGVIPAFYTKEKTTDDGVIKITTLVVPFGMNKAVAATQVSKMVAKIKTVQNDTFLCTVEGDLVNNSSSGYQAEFDVSKYVGDATNELKVGRFYKVQLAYKNTDGNIGYYSTVGVTKFTTLAQVTIQDATGEELDQRQLNFMPESFLGTYSQNYDNADSTEREYSYYYILMDKNRNIIEDSGVLLHNSDNDIRWDESHDIYKPVAAIVNSEVYFIQYYVTSQNGVKQYSPIYKVVDTSESLPSDICGDLAVKNDYDNGCIELTFIDYENPAPMVGSYEVFRAQDDKWESLHRFVAGGGNPSDWVYRDQTVEHGVTYKYGVRQYNASNNIVSARKEIKYVYDWAEEEYVKGTKITADFGDSFLFDGERQLCIKYNPKVTSFKTDILEQKTDTIGSKYPFFFRNGNTYYKEFPISGLISHLSDKEHLFKSYSEMGLEEDDYRRTSSLANKNIYYELCNEYVRGTQYYVYNRKTRRYEAATVTKSKFEKDKYYIEKVKQLKDYDLKTPTTNEVTYNIKAERQFKLDVLAWLNNGKPKLFRSPGEGNYIVRLMSVTLTPNDTVGRMLHTFSCTAYEIAEYNLANFKANGIGDAEDQEENIVKELYMTYRNLNDDDSREDDSTHFNRSLLYGEDLCKNLPRPYDYTTKTVEKEVVKTDEEGNEILDEDGSPVTETVETTEISQVVADFVDITDAVPGTQVNINGNTFTIGATGTFTFKLEGGVTEVSIVDPRGIYAVDNNHLNDSNGEFVKINDTFNQSRYALDAGQVTLGYKGYAESTFDRYREMSLAQVPCRQWYGKGFDIYSNPNCIYNYISAIDGEYEPGRDYYIRKDSEYVLAKVTSSRFALEKQKKESGQEYVDYYIEEGLDSTDYRCTLGETMNDVCNTAINIPYARFVKRETQRLYYNGDQMGFKQISEFNDWNHLYWSYNDMENEINSIEQADTELFNKDYIYEIRTKKDASFIPGFAEPTDGLERGKDYYIDTDLDKYYPLSGAYVDFQNGIIWNNNTDLFKVYFYNDETEYVDLSDIYMIEYTDLLKNDIEQIKIGPGVRAEITYNKITYVYDSSVESYEKTKAALAEYNEALNAWLSSLEMEEPESPKDAQEAYKQYLGVVTLCDRQYKKRHGLS